ASPARAESATASERQVPDEVCGESMVGNRTNGTPQVAAIETIVGTRRDFLVEVSSHNTAEGVLIVRDSLGPLVAADIAQSIECSAFELDREIVVVRVASVFA